MRHNRYLMIVAVIGTVGLGSLQGCSEERKREAARIAAELEAKERGETLPPEPVQIDSSLVTSASADSLGEQALTDGTHDDSSRMAGQQTAASDSVSGQEEESAAPTTVTSNTPAVAMPPVLRDGWTVQVESSPDRAYVEQQVQVFHDRGYDAYLGTVTKDGKTFYRLRVGKFSDRAEAVRVSAEINSMYDLKSWVDKGSW